MQLALNLPTALAARESLFIDHDQAYTTSRGIAKRFGKRHKNVIRDIENLIANCPDPSFTGLNFEPSTYLDPTGRTLPEYRLTHDGFAFLAMRFTGVEAMAWQIAFIQAFNALEAELRARVQREAAALHTLRPLLAPVVAGTEAGQSRSEIGLVVGRSPSSISYHRHTARILGLLPQRKAA